MAQGGPAKYEANGLNIVADQCLRTLCVRLCVSVGVCVCLWVEKAQRVYQKQMEMHLLQNHDPTATY